MRRIGLAVILAVGLFAAGKHGPFKVNAIKSDAPLAIQAQPERSKPRIAVIFNAVPIAEISGPNPKQSSMRAFLEGMRAEGWIDGQNITIERRSAEGDNDRHLALGPGNGEPQSGGSRDLRKRVRASGYSKRLVRSRL